MTDELLLAIDQGTTSSRVLLFNRELQVLGVEQRELAQSFPQPGWVEHDPHQIAQDVQELSATLLQRCAQEGWGKVLGVGISNQRETMVLWDRLSGRALHPAIVWQDRRTTAHCQDLEQRGWADMIQAKTGLLLDPYFSASKLAWLLDQVPDARTRAERGELAAGTIDCWLAWQLSSGQLHVTEASNASRTMLWDLSAHTWDPELLELFQIPPSLLPNVQPSASHFGTLQLGKPAQELPLLAILGDQQAATLGQQCQDSGSVKCTYGTGAFLVQSSGNERPKAAAGLLATALLGDGEQSLFALEGSVFSAGATVQWLRDGLGLFTEAADIAQLAAAADDQERVYLVPAFTGLGAPFWQPDARGMIVGLNRGSDRRSIARAALEASCFRTRDLLEAGLGCGVPIPQRMHIDGGMARNDWFAQRLADLLDVEVVRPDNPEATARGVAMAAGRSAGWWPSWNQAPSAPLSAQFSPTMSVLEREGRYEGWQAAVSACSQLARNTSTHSSS